jgi:hypothetical protein
MACVTHCGVCGGTVDRDDHGAREARIHCSGWPYELHAWRGAISCVGDRRWRREYQCIAALACRYETWVFIGGRNDGG